LIGGLLVAGEVINPFESAYLATSNVFHPRLAAGDAVDVFELDLLATPKDLRVIPRGLAS
jgi:hypothetical protein